MSDGRSRGLVFFVLIALVAGLGGVGIWRLAKRDRPAGGEPTAEDRGGGARRLVKGTGTSWREEEAAGEPSGAIEGVVVDADGKPVEGAAVTVARARARGEEAPTGSYWQPRGTATSAAGGRFRIEKLVPGDYTATATQEGRGPGQRRQIDVKTGETARIEIRLGREGIVLSGRVLDVGGGVVGGARITAMTRTSGGPGRAPALFFTVSSGEGQYRISLGKGGVSVRVEAEGYAPLMDHEIHLARPTTRDLRLVPAGRVAGRVIDRASRQPLPGAEVSITSASRMDFREPRDGTTDGSGHFEISGLEPGNYELMARKGVLIGVGRSVALAVAQSVTDLEIEVDRAHVVSGRVKDDAGAGIGGVRISAYRDAPPFGQAARTRSNPDGSYALEGMLPGGYRLNAYEEGYGFAAGRARVLSADVAGVDLELPRGVKVTGRVLTADGKPVEGARVRATLETRQAGSNMTTSADLTTTGADGGFELTRISPGTVRVSAYDEQHGAATLPPEEIKAGTPRVLTLKLARGNSVAGVVRTEDGRPAADVRVTATSRSGGMILPGDPVVTGADGRYRLANLPSGRLLVTASRGGRPDFDMSGERPDQKNLTLGETEDKTGVDLVVPPAGFAIKGTVTTPDGKPVPGAVVTAGVERFGRAFRGGSRELRAYTQIDGLFALEDVGKGPYTLWAVHPDHPEAELKGVAGGASGVKLAFPPDTSVSGLVVSAEGKPVATYSITVLPGAKPGETPDERRRRQMSSFDARMQQVQDPGGKFEVRRLAAGAYELNVNAPGGASATQAVAVQPGERKAGLRIQLQAGVRLIGRVLEHGTGKPIAGTMVLAMGRGNARTEGEVGPDGGFVLEGAPLADSIRLSIQADYTRYVGESKEVEIKPGQTQVDAGTILLLPGNARDRMMLDPTERGEAGAYVRVEGGKPTVRSVQDDGPAARAGLKTNDLVTAINGTSTRDLGNGALGYLVSGKPGTTVTLTVETPGAGAPRTVTLTLEPGKPPAARSN